MWIRAATSGATVSSFLPFPSSQARKETLSVVCEDLFCSLGSKEVELWASGYRGTAETGSSLVLVPGGQRRHRVRVQPPGLHALCLRAVVASPPRRDSSPFAETTTPVPPSQSTPLFNSSRHSHPPFPLEPHRWLPLPRPRGLRLNSSLLAELGWVGERVHPFRNPRMTSVSQNGKRGRGRKKLYSSFGHSEQKH